MLEGFELVFGARKTPGLIELRPASRRSPAGSLMVPVVDCAAFHPQHQWSAGGGFWICSLGMFIAVGSAIAVEEATAGGQKGFQVAARFHGVMVARQRGEAQVLLSVRVRLHRAGEWFV